tara:strand:- start:1216 stop:1794 length:579 start_codon:yes stop_codon:yes gene_type:complete
LKIFINLLLLTNLVVTQDYQFKKIEKSLLINSFGEEKISFLVTLQQNKNNLSKYFSSNIWLSENFSINTTISPNIQYQNIDFYYNTSFIYVPEILKTNSHKANLSFTIHRQRFYFYNSYRWFDFKIIYNINIYDNKFNIGWIYFEKRENKHVFNFSFSKNLNKRIRTFFGLKLYKELEKINFQPNIKIEMGI